jgi:propionyl-CoA carboxylase beta chain
MASSNKREQLSDRRKQALQKGGPEHIAARGKKGALTARERVLTVLDPETFVELDLFVDGVVAGHGLVDGREVYIFAQGWTHDSRQDRASDSRAALHARAEGAVQKIVKVIDLAMMSGAPIIGLYDCGVDDPDRGRGGYTDVFLHNVMASGMIPQISAVMGPCLGGAAYPATMTDFVIMVKGSSHLSVAGPEAARSSGEETTLEELGGALTHSTKSGIAHLAADDETQCLETIRRLLAYLPQNNLETAPIVEAGDPADRKDGGLDAVAGEAAAGAYDIRAVVEQVVDGGEFLELMPSWAQNLVIGFARLGGRSVGIVGNQSLHGEGRLDSDASVKGARFVRFCDAFNIPLVTFVDTPGYVPGAAEEHGGAARHGAKLLCAYCEATVPKLTVVTGRAYHEAYEVMGSKGVRADFCFAWPAADMRVAGLAPAEPAPGKSEADGGGEALLYLAAENGLLDDVIQPSETRPRLIAALRACISKREGRPPKKHGNIPL